MNRINGAFRERQRAWSWEPMWPTSATTLPDRSLMTASQLRNISQRNGAYTYQQDEEDYPRVVREHFVSSSAAARTEGLNSHPV